MVKLPQNPSILSNSVLQDAGESNWTGISRSKVYFGSENLPPPIPSADQPSFFKRLRCFFSRSDNGKGDIGAVKALRTLVKYVRVSENSQILKGFIYQYGIPAMSATCFAFGPLGWLMGGLMVVPSIVISKRGEKIIEKLEKDGLVSKTSGPLARIASIQTHWAKALETKMEDTAEALEKAVKDTRQHVRQIIQDVNSLIDDLLPDNELVPNINKVRERLHWKPQGRAAGFISHALVVNLKYKDKLAGKLIGFLSKWSGRIPFVKWPVKAVILGAQGLLMLVSHRAVKKATIQALK